SSCELTESSLPAARGCRPSASGSARPDRKGQSRSRRRRTGRPPSAPACERVAGLHVRSKPPRFRKPVARLKMLEASICSTTPLLRRIGASADPSCSSWRPICKRSSQPSAKPDKLTTCPLKERRRRPMKTGMNLLLWTTHVTDEHFPLFANLKATGFDGVELPLSGGDAAHYVRIRKELDNHGLACTAVTIATPDANPISPDVNLRKAGLDRIKWAVEMLAIL